MVSDNISEILKDFNKISPWDGVNNLDAFQRLADIGVFVPWADSFKYRNQGILLTGTSGSGKSSVAKKFTKWYLPNRHRLSEDTTIVMFEGNQIFVYQTPITLYINIGAVVEQGSRFPISAILYFSKEPGLAGTKEGDLEEAIHMMFPCSFSRDAQNRSVLEKAYEAFKGIPLLRFQFYDNANRKYQAVKSALTGLNDSEM